MLLRDDGLLSGRLNIHTLCAGRRVNLAERPNEEVRKRAAAAARFQNTNALYLALQGRDRWQGKAGWAVGRWLLPLLCRFGGGCSHHCRLIIFIITVSSPRRRSTKVSRCETLLLLPSPRLHQPFHRSTLGLLRGIPAQAVCPRVPTPLFTQFSPALANESEDTVPARRFEEAASSPRFGFLAARPSYTSLPRLAGSHHSRLPLACLCHCNCHGLNFTSPVLASICRQPTTF
ncbi:hypothetical protein L1887_49184 [Cichorium endivia]|nr:hypothetical protein L1887_49184 [Cichorium endivia]